MGKRKLISKQPLDATVLTLFAESDRGCVILMSSVLESKLENVHEAYVAAHLTGSPSPDEFFKRTLAGLYGPLSNFAGKINIAYAYGLISRRDYDALNVIRGLRNEAAHCDFAFRIEDPGIATAVAKLAPYESVEGTFVIDSPLFAMQPLLRLQFVQRSFGLFQVLNEKHIAGLEQMLKTRRQHKKQ